MNLPPYHTFPELTAAGLLLRQIEERDLTAILDISFYDAHPAANLAEASTMLWQITEDYAQGNCLHWGIADAQTNHIMGTVGFYRGFAENTGELGCVLKSAFRGRGIMQSAMELVIKFGLKQIGLQTIIAQTTPQNTPAIKLLERLQFRLAATDQSGEIRYILNQPTSQRRELV